MFWLLASCSQHKCLAAVRETDCSLCFLLPLVRDLSGKLCSQHCSTSLKSRVRRTLDGSEFLKILLPLDMLLNMLLNVLLLLLLLNELLLLLNMVVVLLLSLLLLLWLI